MYDVCVYSDLRIIRLWTYYSRWDKTQLPQETIADRARYVCVCVCVCVLGRTGRGGRGMRRGDLIGLRVALVGDLNDVR